MGFFDLVKARRSVRGYTDALVKEADLAAILEAANLAPSAGNQQCYSVVVVRDPATRAAIADAAGGQRFAAVAPICLAFVADAPKAEERLRRPSFAVQDAAIAATHAMLAAAELQLGTCWIGGMNQTKVGELIGAPEGQEVVCVLTVGHPADSPAPKKRRDLTDLVREERFGGRGYQKPV